MMNDSPDQVKKLLAELRVKGESRSTDMYALEHFERYQKTINYLKKNINYTNGKILDLASNPVFTFLLAKEFDGQFFGTSHQAPKFPSESKNKITTSHVDIEYMNSHIEYKIIDNINLETDSLPFENEYFDLICCTEIIEHLIYSPTTMLCEIYRVLKTSGIFCLTTDNANNLLKMIRILLNKQTYFPLYGDSIYCRHNREYLKHELEDLLSGIGFKISMSGYFNYNPFRYSNNVRYRFLYDMLYFFSFFPFLRTRRKHIIILAQKGNGMHWYYPDWLYRGHYIGRS